MRDSTFRPVMGGRGVLRKSRRKGPEKKRAETHTAWCMPRPGSFLRQGRNIPFPPP